MRGKYAPLGQKIMERLTKMGERPTQQTLIVLMERAGYEEDYRRVSTYLNGTRMPRPGFIEAVAVSLEMDATEEMELWRAYAATFPARVA